MKKNMSMHISRILRYLMVALLHIRWISSEVKEGHRSTSAKHNDGKVVKQVNSSTSMSTLSEE
jgi:hypothetical protein